MGKVAFVFPGQGSQTVGMGHALARCSPAAQDVFHRADEALGFSLSQLCFDGPAEELTLTANTQPAILSTSIACLRALEQEGVSPDFVAGHSLGEYSAVVAAGGLRLEAAVVTVRKRGQYMQEAVPVGIGAMAAILKAERELVEAACREAAQDQVCAPANFNSPGQIVIAGHKEAVQRAIEVLQAQGVRRAVTLPVSAPFHCALMEPAAQRLTEDLRNLGFSDLTVPLVNNVDAEVVCGAEQVRSGLERQVSSPVRWEESVKRLIQAGVTAFVEVGHGTVLGGLIKQIDRSARTHNVSDEASLKATVEALKEHAQTESEESICLS
jgi:[acyl-carrier-protein] S-malonyltransferase